MNQLESEFDEIIEDAISEKIAHPDDDMLIENIGIHHIELSNELSSPPQSSESTLEQERTFEEIEDSIKNSTHWIKSSIDPRVGEKNSPWVKNLTLLEKTLI